MESPAGVGYSYDDHNDVATDDDKVCFLDVLLRLACFTAKIESYFQLRSHSVTLKIVAGFVFIA